MNIIKKNFSKYADHYDDYCSVQNHSAKVLVSKIKKNKSASSGEKILDIGCGTGNYTLLLKEKFIDANIKAVDISNKMVEIASKKTADNKIEFVVADAEIMELDEKFDIITSNASFQWFLNLEKSLAKYKKLLGNGCVIIFSIFGPKTFYELNASLKELLGKDINLSSCGFIEKGVLKKILKKNFNDVLVEEEIFQEKYDSLMQLLNKIRYTGTRGNGISVNSFWTHERINAIEEIYKKKFNNLTATYQIFYCQGKKYKND
ncbi:MAG: malonyl-ACP O-methyltransferase BioC [Elusimicrobiota bacterium]